MPHQDKKTRALIGQLTWRDYYMLLNMVLFLVVGSLTLYRAIAQNAPWLSYLMGLGFISAGGYRLYLFCKTLSRM